MPGGAGIFPEEAHCALSGLDFPDKAHCALSGLLNRIEAAVAPVSDSATGDVEAIGDR